MTLTESPYEDEVRNLRRTVKKAIAIVHRNCRWKKQDGEAWVCGHPATKIARCNTFSREMCPIMIPLRDVELE